MEIRDTPRTHPDFPEKNPRYVEGSIVSSTIISTLSAAKPLAAKKHPPAWLYLIILGLALALVRVTWLAWAQGTPQATIIIHPTYVDKKAVIQLSAAVSPLTASQSTARQLTSQQTSPQIRVPATGIVRQPATSARGTLTFSNPTSSPQTILAGIQLNAGPGIQIITDRGAALPPGSSAGAGSVLVPAHVLATGTQGNISPFTLDGLCVPCGNGIVVKNATPFAGGQDAATSTVVSLADLDKVARSELPALAAQARATLGEQRQKGEQVGTPITCAQQVGSTPPIGTRATLVSIQVIETCRALAYRPADVQQKAAALFRSEVQRLLDPHLILAGPITSHIETPFLVKMPEMLSIPVQVTGRWIYTLSGVEQAQLIRDLAGESRQRALGELEGEPGIAEVSIENSQGDRLPHDPGQLSLRIVFPPPSGD